MSAELLDWLDARRAGGASPVSIAAAVARAVAPGVGLPIDASAPAWLRHDTTEAPGCEGGGPALVALAYERAQASERRRRAGVHYTPFPVAARLAQVALDGAPAGPVCDPAVGGGAFLVAAGEVLTGRGHDRATVARDLLWGIDVDPGAADVARVVVSLWVGGPHWVDPGGHIAVADTLVDGASAFGANRHRFAAVVGNPPFLGQLRSETSRSAAESQALRRRWGVDAGAYADTSTYFLLAALELAAPGGHIMLVLPQSVLAGAAAAPIREAVDDAGALTGLWIADQGVFDADVEVCAPLIVRDATREGTVRRWTGRDLEPRHAFRRDSDQPWAAANADLRGVPVVVIRPGRRLGAVATATAGFRAQFYGLAPHTHEGPDGGPSLVTVGMIDPLRNRWGSGAPFRFAKRRWRAPVVDLVGLGDADPAMHEWVRSRLVPKLLVATQTRVIEVCVDVDGTMVPSTPVISVEAAPESLWPMAAALSAPALSAAALGAAAGAAMSADTLRLRAGQLLDLPLPTEERAWAEGTRRAREAAAARTADAWRRAMWRLGEAMNAAYGVDDEELTSWWHDRLPAWR